MIPLGGTRSRHLPFSYGSLISRRFLVSLATAGSWSLTEGHSWAGGTGMLLETKRNSKVCLAAVVCLKTISWENDTRTTHSPTRPLPLLHMSTLTFVGFVDLSFL